MLRRSMAIVRCVVVSYHVRFLSTLFTLLTRRKDEQISLERKDRTENREQDINGVVSENRSHISLSALGLRQLIPISCKGHVLT